MRAAQEGHGLLLATKMGWHDNPHILETTMRRSTLCAMTAAVLVVMAFVIPPDAMAADASFGDVAFTTYEVEGFRVVFTTDSKAVKTWRNMNGAAVNGTYIKKGNDIEVKWDPAASHHGSLSEKFRQMGPCSMARYARVDKKGSVVEGAPQIYQKSKPKCDTVRITN